MVDKDALLVKMSIAMTSWSLKICASCLLLKRLDVPAALEILRSLRTVEDAPDAEDVPKQTENASDDFYKGETEVAAPDEAEDVEELSTDRVVISCSAVPQ